MGSDSIAHEAEGLVGYWLRGHEGEKNNAPFTDFFTDFEKKNPTVLQSIIMLTIPCFEWGRENCGKCECA